MPHPVPAHWRSEPMRTSAGRVCAQGGHAILHERFARRRNAVLEPASPLLGSGLGKIGQAGDPGTMTPRRDRGRSGAQGAGR